MTASPASSNTVESTCALLLDLCKNIDCKLMTPVEHADEMESVLQRPNVQYLEWSEEDEGGRNLRNAWHRYIDLLMNVYEETLENAEWDSADDKRSWEDVVIGPLRRAWESDDVNALLSDGNEIQSILAKRCPPALASIAVLNHVLELCDQCLQAVAWAGSHAGVIAMHKVLNDLLGEKWGDELPSQPGGLSGLQQSIMDDPFIEAIRGGDEVMLKDASSPKFDRKVTTPRTFFTARAIIRRKSLVAHTRAGKCLVPNTIAHSLRLFPYLPCLCTPFSLAVSRHSLVGLRPPRYLRSQDWCNISRRKCFTPPTSATKMVLGTARSSVVLVMQRSLSFAQLVE